MDWLPIAISSTIAFCSLIVSILVFSRAKKKDTSRDGEDRGIIASELGYIKAGVDDLKNENRESRATVSQMGLELTQVKESCKQAHKRIDDLAEYHKPHHS